MTEAARTHETTKQRTISAQNNIRLQTENVLAEKRRTAEIRQTKSVARTCSSTCSHRDNTLVRILVASSEPFGRIARLSGSLSEAVLIFMSMFGVPSARALAIHLLSLVVYCLVSISPFFPVPLRRGARDHKTKYGTPHFKEARPCSPSVDLGPALNLRGLFDYICFEGKPDGGYLLFKEKPKLGDGRQRTKRDTATQRAQPNTRNENTKRNDVDRKEQPCPRRGPLELISNAGAK